MGLHGLAGCFVPHHQPQLHGVVSALLVPILNAAAKPAVTSAAAALPKARLRFEEQASRGSNVDSRTAYVQRIARSLWVFYRVEQSARRCCRTHPIVAFCSGCAGAATPKAHPPAFEHGRNTVLSAPDAAPPGHGGSSMAVAVPLSLGPGLAAGFFADDFPTVAAPGQAQGLHGLTVEGAGAVDLQESHRRPVG